MNLMKTIFGGFSTQRLKAARPLLLALLLAGCMNSPTAAPSPEALEIGTREQSAEPLPSIPMGSSMFHATDPSSVSLASGQVQFVEFFAYWCTVCKAMAPAVHGLDALYGEQVNFVYLDREDPATDALRNQLGYVYQPHFFLLAGDGTVLGEWRGYVEVEVLRQAIVAAIP